MRIADRVSDPVIKLLLYFQDQGNQYFGWQIAPACLFKEVIERG
jgi:hypothetical protein